MKLGREFQFQIFHTAGDIMLNRIALMMGLMVLTTVSSASAATVAFRGVITNANPVTSPGIVLPLGDFTLSLQTVDGSPASIVGGQYVFGFGSGSPVIVNVTSGFVSAPINGLLAFSVTSPGPSLTSINSSFTFAGVSGVTAGLVNQANLDNLYPPIYTTTWSLSNTNGLGQTLASYSGTISSVPEPGSMIALAGLAIGATGWRLRKQKKLAK